MNHYIYKITNKINRKVYIGKHSSQKENDTYFGSGVALKLAIKKYGKEMFYKEILCYCDSEEELNKQEIQFIDKCKSYSYGYNMTKGGEGLLGRIPSREQIQKQSNSIKKTYSNNPELAKAISERGKLRLGIKNPFFGRKLSEEHIEKMRVARIAAISGDKNTSAKKVVCIETGEVFGTATEAVKMLGLKDCGSIIKCCRNQRKTAGGYTWKYVTYSGT